MEHFTLTIRQNNSLRRLSADGSESLLQRLRGAGYPLQADCGGSGRCGKCLVSVTGPLRDRDGLLFRAEEQPLPACRYFPAGDCRITLPGDEEMQIVTGGIARLPLRGEGLGAAVDIGTTTLAFMLYDLSDGRLLARRGCRSAQRPFGADVIARISHCARPEGRKELQDVLCRQMEQELASLCREAGQDMDRIRCISVAGNTVMEHIFAGLDPQSIGVAPFRPLSLFGQERPAEPLLRGLHPEARLYLCPAVAGYVGGDITAGLLAAGGPETEDLTLFLDVGTNGEMALGDKRGWLCCAAAAGPAFEGAEIDCGMSGGPGAIDRVWTEGDALRFHVIGGGEARGLCGSGLLDAIACLLELGLILPSGRMDADGLSPALAKRLRRNGRGELSFYLTESVWLSASDLRAVQLAKAALRAGIETLLSLRGFRAEDLHQCLLAGGFGSFMNVRSACILGLLPPCLEKKTRSIGNAAGAGAALALDPAERTRLETLAGLCRYHELSGSRLFNENYLDFMSFDE